MDEQFSVASSLRLTQAGAWCSNHNPNPPDMRRLLSRRGFLRAGVTAGVLLGTQGIGRAAWAEACDGVLGTVPPEQRSIQLFTMIPFIQASPEVTLQQLYAIGYRRVEHAIITDAESFRAACDGAGPEGIRSSSGHQGIGHPFDPVAFQATLDFARTVGQRFIVVPQQTAEGEDGWAAYAETLNAAGAMAREQGFESVGYHNHAAEYTPFSEGSDLRPVDVLIQNTDPELVHMEMDICWVWAAETDPVEYLEKYPYRYRQFHVKDLDGVTGQPTFPGLGVIDFNRVFEAATQNQVIEEYIVEQDGAGPAAFQTAQMGWDLLEQARFACPAAETEPDPAPSDADAGPAPEPTATPAPGPSAGGGGLPATGGGLVALGLAALSGAIALRSRGSDVGPEEP